MNKQFAIFDMDGTLVDSMAYWRDLARELLALHHITQVPADVFDAIEAMTARQSAQYFVEIFQLNCTPQDLEAQMSQLMADHYRYDIDLKPNAGAYIRQLKAGGAHLCVASVTNLDLVEACLSRLGILDCFDFIRSCQTLGISKDQPDIYLGCAQTFGCAPCDVAVFEDALYAAQTAKSAGFHVVGVYDEGAKGKWADLQALAHEAMVDFNPFPVNTMRTALTIAGSDSSGGAGIQADIKTMTMNGVFAMSAITALTAQNTTGVSAILEVSPDFLIQQLDMVFQDIFPDAVKIGMVASAPLIDAIADTLTKYKATSIVLDPVMGATSGASLLQSQTVTALKTRLLPLATLVTPNILEAQVLSGLTIETAQDMERAALAISQENHCAVLVKGGHAINDANDLLCQDSKLTWFQGKRIDNPNTHGTGCTLSSAIASNLAKGQDLETAVQHAKDYISGALSAMLDLGKGSGPMAHNFAIWKESRQ